MNPTCPRACARTRRTRPALQRLRAALPTLLLGASLCGLVQAAPRTPVGDDEVIGTLPGGRDPQARQERLLRAAVKAGPSGQAADLGTALHLARQAIGRARRDGDPRELGVAQAALAPWWSRPDAPAPVRLLRATIRQSQHAFAPALAELDALIAAPTSAGHASAPGPGVPLEIQAQAELTRITLLQAQGRLQEATTGCARLAGERYAALGTATTLPARVCAAELASLQGRDEAADRALRRLAGEHAATTTDPGLVAWLALVRAELAERRGDPAARALYRQALGQQPDVYTRAAYADWLLDRRLDTEVLALTPERLQDLPDALLLRHAIALRRLDRPTAMAAIDLLQARFDAARLRGDTLHRREEARHLLELRDQPAAALPLARAHWAEQKEPADARVLLDSARAAGQPQAGADVMRHLERTGLRDVRLSPPALAGTPGAALTR